MSGTRTRRVMFIPRKTSVAALREALVGDQRRSGIPGKFKAAVRAGLHYWRDTYVPLHFQRTAYYRYNAPVPKYHAPHKQSLAGKSLKVGNTELFPPYSYKNYRQALNGLTITQGQDLPLFLSGNTRRDIVHGHFRTFGAGTRVMKGSWSGSQICWAWLAKLRRINKSIDYLNPQEHGALMKRIESTFHRLVRTSKYAPTSDPELRNLI